MKRADFEKLKLALEQALAIERGELLPARVTIREVPAQPVRQVCVPLEDSQPALVFASPLPSGKIGSDE